MSEKIKNQLTGVPETLLSTLWAKATEMSHPKPLLRDEKAVEVLEQIDYDFSKFKQSKISQVGCCVRAHLIDEETKRFLSQHPDAVVIQLGAGLDARYKRLRPTQITHWYDLDLPETIEVRQKVLSQSEKNTYIAGDLFDNKWIETVKSHQKPTLIILEGVLMYFEPEDVKRFLTNLCESFEEATILMDMLTYIAVGNFKHHDVGRKMSRDIDFKWSELDSKTLETWHPKLKLELELFLSDYDQGRFPWLFRQLYKLPYFYRRFNQRVIRLHIG